MMPRLRAVCLPSAVVLAWLVSGCGGILGRLPGGNDPDADLGKGSGYEWVGWDDVQPEIRFDFGMVGLVFQDMVKGI